MKDIFLRAGLIAAFALAAPAAFSAAPADAPATPAAPDKREAAEKLYRDLYGAEHDQAAASKDPAVKLAFAKKLSESVKVAADSPETAQLLREYAALFAAADPAGFPIALEMLKAGPSSGKARDAALQTLAGQADKIMAKEKPAAKAQTASDLLWVLRELARAQAAARTFPAATATLDKAKSWVRTHLKGAADLLKEIEEQSGAVARAGREAAALRTAELTLQTVPSDPAANRVVGLHRYLHETDPGCKCDECKAEFTDAAPFLAKAEGAFAKLGEALANKEPSDLAIADACRASAQAATAKPDKEALIDRAVRHYRAVLAAEPSHPEALRIKLLLEQLAPETPSKTEPDTKADPKTKAVAKAGAKGPFPAKRADESQEAYAKRCLPVLSTGLPANDLQFVRVTVEDNGKTVHMVGWTANSNAAKMVEERAKLIPGVESVDNDVRNSPGRFGRRPKGNN